MQNARAVFSRFLSSKIKNIRTRNYWERYICLLGWVIFISFFFMDIAIFLWCSYVCSIVRWFSIIGSIHCSQYIADTRCGTYRIHLYTLILNLPLSHLFRFSMIMYITTRIRITTCFCIISHQYHLSWENSRHFHNRPQTQASSVSNFSAIYKSCLF